MVHGNHESPFGPTKCIKWVSLCKSSQGAFYSLVFEFSVSYVEPQADRDYDDFQDDERGYDGWCPGWLLDGRIIIDEQVEDGYNYGHAHEQVPKEIPQFHAT